MCVCACWAAELDLELVQFKSPWWSKARDDEVEALLQQKKGEPRTQVCVLACCCRERQVVAMTQRCVCVRRCACFLWLLVMLVCVVLQQRGVRGLEVLGELREGGEGAKALTVSPLTNAAACMCSSSGGAYTTSTRGLHQ